MAQTVRFSQSYNGYAPQTIFAADPNTKTLSPYDSGEAYTGAGYSFGQERVANPDEFAGFSVGAPISRNAQLASIKNDLNNFQQETFNSQQPDPNKRQSSVIQDNINTENKNLADALAEFNTLKGKLTSLPAANYEQSYNDLRTKAGVPGLENEFTTNQKTIRELPYVNRQNFGNAGVATEGQLTDDTQQKGIPLEIQQANLIDRLKLAGDFVNNSLKFKEMDANSAREAIATAIGLAGETINLSKGQLDGYYERQKELETREQAAQQFALENAIDQPYYQIGNTIYDTATRTPKFVNNGGTISTIDGSKAYSKPEQFFADSGINSFDQIYHLNSTTIADKNAVLELRQQYPDAGIAATDSFAVASSKLQNSRIYQDSVRGPVGSGGGGGTAGVLGLSNQQIDNISPLVTQFQNSPIVQNYNTIGEGYSFARSLSNDTKNPADDQALIYALAKALDPGSVVREGEYATVQKYAQSMVQSYGKSVTQALNGSGFLSTDARKNIKATIESRFKAAETSYNNLYGETSRRINLIGGTDKGDQLLNNYGGAFVQPSSSSSSVGSENSASTPSAEEPKQQGFWNKTINWLFGED